VCCAVVHFASILALIMVVTAASGSFVNQPTFKEVQNPFNNTNNTQIPRTVEIVTSEVTTSRQDRNTYIIIRPHSLHAMHRCGLLVQMSHVS